MGTDAVKRGAVHAVPNTPRDQATRLLQQAVLREQAGQMAQAEDLCLQALATCPGLPAASLMAARLVVARRQFDQAAALLQPAADAEPDNADVVVQLALALAACGQLPAAAAALARLLALAPEAHRAWLMLGVVKGRLGDAAGSLQAAHQAVTRAQRAGQWLDQASTPPDLLPLVVQAIQQVRNGRRELFLGSFAELRQRHGNAALRRMDHALAVYLGELQQPPGNPHQRPLFFYFPGLPDLPYHAPDLQPWAGRLREAFPQIRAEALQVLDHGAQDLPSFIPARSDEERAKYLGGPAAEPRWQAYFFYRHGQRYDHNHTRCPMTSALLDSLDLCRIPGQAPEICFSVLRPGTLIKPHHGVTNTRLVMHLPLLVPADCALNLVGEGVHRWVEGEPVMFDDSFLHEAWNHSAQTRVILLMDCWNPHLTEVERQAYTELVQMIGSLKPAVQA